MKKWQIVLIVIIIAAGIGGFVAYQMWNKPHTKVEDVESVVLTVGELTNAFSTDEAAANEKYLNKAIEVTGTVSNTETNQDGNLVVYLVEDGAENDVQCTMRDSNAQVTAGGTVTVKGFCTGSSLFGVLLTDCVIL